MTTDRLAALEQGLDEAVSAFEGAPWRVAIIGRVSAGKSSLVNALAGREVQATGLGGVTRQATEIDLGTVVAVDTAGIDDVVGALDALDPVLARADAVIWVVDGLQPLTESERRVVSALHEPGAHLYVVVTRLDLVDPDQPPLVLERVQALTAPHRPRAVLRLDLRAPLRARPPEILLARAPFPSLVRARALAQWTTTALADLDTLLPPDPAERLEQLWSRWRSCVRAAEREVERQVASGALTHPERALHRLARVADRQRTAFVEGLEDEGGWEGLLAQLGPPEIPILPAPDASPRWHQLFSGMGGASAATRLVRAEAARWLAEGEVVLDEWVQPLRDADDPEQRRRAEGLSERIRAARDRATLD